MIELNWKQVAFIIVASPYLIARHYWLKARGAYKTK